MAYSTSPKSTLPLYPALLFDSGGAERAYEHGSNHYNGSGVPRDYSKAFMMFQLAAAKGHSKSQYLLGEMLRDGEGCGADKKQAFEMYQKACDQGNPSAMFRLAAMLKEGEGCRADKKRAFSLFQKLAIQHQDSRAQNIAGRMLLTGDGCKQDTKKAFEMFLISAERRNSEAQNTIGEMLVAGEGCKRDEKKAFEWFAKSATNGNHTAQNHMGEMLREGTGCARNLVKSGEFFEKSSFQGNSKAKLSLSAMLRKDNKIIVEEKPVVEEPKEKRPIDFDDIINALSHSRETVNNEKLNLILSATVHFILQRAQQMENQGDFELSKAYSQVALHEGEKVFPPDVRRRLQQSINVISSKDSTSAISIKNYTAHLQDSLSSISSQFSSLPDEATTNDLQLSDKKKDGLEREIKEMGDRVLKVDKREKAIREYAEEYEEQSEDWTKLRLGYDVTHPDHLMKLILETKEEVERDREKWEEKREEEEAARKKLVASGIVLKERIECFHSFLSYVEQHIHFRSLLKSVQHISGAKKKCYIHMVEQKQEKDEKEGKEREKYQMKINKLKLDLEKTGIEVIVGSLEGVQDGEWVLLVQSPIEENESNGEEFISSLEKLKKISHNVIPCSFEGFAFPFLPSNTLTLHFSVPKEYCEQLISLPKGLIPTFLNLENNKIYSKLLSGYRAQLQLLYSNNITSC